jgi:putative Mn2+ efflux pump MntP
MFFKLLNGKCQIGKSFGHFFDSGIEALAGLIFIGIGSKILLEYLFA